MANNGISPERQTAYYVGQAISVIGVLLFLSTFLVLAQPSPSVTITGGSGFGQMQNMQAEFRQHSDSVMSSFVGRALGGFVLIVIGQVIANIGKFGPAGSGVVLDPQQARKDVEPWSRMVGGVVNDALEEIQPAKDPVLKRAAGLFVDFPADQPLTPSEDRPAIERLSEIKILLDQGMLTPEEYEAKRKAIIDSI